MVAQRKPISHTSRHPRTHHSLPRRTEPTRRGLTLEALPIDSWERARIEPAVDLAVEQLSHDGLDVCADQPISPGRRLALGFPDSPFLPRPGTVARVDACIPVTFGYRLHLSYEMNPAA